jgi:hypothetical protein
VLGQVLQGRNHKACLERSAGNVHMSDSQTSGRLFNACVQLAAVSIHLNCLEMRLICNFRPPTIGTYLEFGILHLFGVCIKKIHLYFPFVCKSIFSKKSMHLHHQLIQQPDLYIGVTYLEMCVL